MAVQRQTATSKSAKPASKAQHGVVGGAPTTTFTSPRMSAHTPSFKASLGQVSGGGFGMGLGLGFGLHPHPPEPHAVENVEKKRRERMIMVAESFVLAMV